MDAIRLYGPALGRVCVCVIFIVTAFQNLLNWGGTVDMLDRRGFPLPAVALAIAVALEIGGSLLLLLATRVRLGATLLILFLVVTLLCVHNFWRFEGAERHAQSIQFMKNLALIGGLLQIVGFGAGPATGGRRKRG